MKQLVAIALAVVVVTALTTLLLLSDGPERGARQDAPATLDGANAPSAPLPAVGAAPGPSMVAAADRELVKVSAPPTSGPIVAGRVVLLDDSAVADCEVWAMDPEISFAGMRHARGALIGPRDALAHARTDANGRFEFAFPGATPADQQFRIWHGAKQLPQSEELHGLSMAAALVHRLPTGRLSVVACDVDGQPLAEVMLSLRRARGRDAVGVTAANGRYDFHLAEPSNCEVFAYHKTRHVGAIVEHVAFAPAVGATQQLTLLPMDAGSLRIEVQDPSGVPVERFALRVKLRGQTIRFVRSEQLVGDLLTELPECELEVILERPYSDSPAMYELPTQGRERLCTPDRSATALVRFTVNRQSRLCFDVTMGGDRSERMSVRIRRSSVDEEHTWRTIDVEQYQEAGSRVATEIRSSGRWYSAPLEPGYYEVELRKGASAELVMRDWISLSPGAIVVRTVAD